jgi:hypothetical protein
MHPDALLNPVVNTGNGQNWMKPSSSLSAGRAKIMQVPAFSKSR